MNTLTSASITWSSWQAWSRCPRTCTAVGATPSVQTRTKTYTNNRPQSLCSDISTHVTPQSQPCNEKVPCPGEAIIYLLVL